MDEFSAQVILRTVDSIPANYVTNTFGLRIPNALPALTSASAAIKAFYDAISTSMLPDTISQTGHVIKYVLRGQPQPNYPQLEQTFSLAAAPTTSSLPSEVAICLSFQGERVGGQPQARRQGRIYIGPLRTTVNVSGRPGSAFRATMASAAANFKDAIEAIPDASWVVYSTVNQSSTVVTNGWIDDAFDTQRRRGVERTARTTWA